MKSNKFIYQVIDLVGKFESENQGREITLHDFTGYLVNHVNASAEEQALPDVRFGKEEEKAGQTAYQLDNNIGRLFIYMSRYAKFYIKKALHGTSLQTAEDFTCLAILLSHQDLSKKELISYNLQEKTSGTEVIRRLINAGFAVQIDDINDKRSKRVSITTTGKELLYKLFVEMSYVGKIVTGDLSSSEKYNLNYLLQRLESFHYHIHENKLVKTMDELKLAVESTVINPISF